MNKHRHSRCHYKRNSGSTPAGMNNPPHRRACGTTNSRWLAAARSVSSDNDLRSGRLNSSSDDLRADAATTKPSPASPLGGEDKLSKPKSRRSVRGGGGGRRSRWRRSLLRLPPPQHRRRQPPAHRQIPTQVLSSGRASTSTRRRRARVRAGQPKNTNAALAVCDVLGGPPVRAAQQPPVRRADSHAPPSGGRWHRKLSQRAKHAGADDACGRPAPRCRSLPPPLGW
jgi:hypothetical protein